MHPKPPNPIHYKHPRPNALQRRPISLFFLSLSVYHEGQVNLITVMSHIGHVHRSSPELATRAKPQRATRRPLPRADHVAVLVPGAALGPPPEHHRAPTPSHVGPPHLARVHAHRHLPRPAGLRRAHAPRQATSAFLRIGKLWTGSPPSLFDARGLSPICEATLATTLPLDNSA
jgi:hypothetical protein